MLQREIARRTDLTDRTIMTVIDDLVEGGFVERTRIGRRNTYRVIGDQSLSPRNEDDVAIGRLIAAVRPIERLDYRGVIDLVANHVVDFLGDGCVVTLVAQDAKTLELLSVQHPDQATAASVAAFFTTVPQRLGEGISGTVAASGIPALIPVISGSDEHAALSPEGAASMAAINLTSLVVVPLVAHDLTLGTIAAFRTGPGRAYGHEHVDLLAQFAERAASAIHDASRSHPDGLADAQSELVRIATDALLVFGADGRCLMANPAAAALFGRPQQTIRQTPFTDLFPHLERLPASDGTESGRVELKACRSDGTIITVTARFTSLVTLEGESQVCASVETGRGQPDPPTA